jgi:hypothetical protein
MSYGLYIPKNNKLNQQHLRLTGKWFQAGSTAQQGFLMSGVLAEARVFENRNVCSNLVGIVGWYECCCLLYNKHNQFNGIHSLPTIHKIWIQIERSAIDFEAVTNGALIYKERCQGVWIDDTPWPW